MISLLDNDRWWEVELPKLLTVKNVTVQINEAVDQHQHYKIHTIGKYQSLFSLHNYGLYFVRKVERGILDCSEYLSTNVNTKTHQTLKTCRKNSSNGVKSKLVKSNLVK